MTSVAVVVLDTLRYDSFNDAFDWLDGMHFSRAYSTSHWTVPAHASLFTGEYASDVNVHGQSPTLDCDKQTLAEAFQDAGYRTRGFNWNTQLDQYEGWERGFDEFVGETNLGRLDDDVFDWGQHIEETEPGIQRNISGLLRCITEDVDTIRSLRYGYELIQRDSYQGGAEIISRRVSETDFGDDEFLFVNMMDAHTPYHPPEEGTDPVTVVIADALAENITDADEIRAAYQASVEFLAEAYKEMHSELRDSFDYVVTLSDHGELLGEHGLWNHSIGLHPELTHVPLVISGDDIADETRHEVVDILDVHQTVADLAGVPVDSHGRNLLGNIEAREHLFESHGLLPFHEEQFERKDVSKSEFQHWQTPLHGFVTNDGAYCYEPEPGSFRCIGETSLQNPEKRLTELANDLDTPDSGEDQPEVSNEVKDQLKKLGYA